MPRELHEARASEVAMLRDELRKTEDQLRAAARRYIAAESEAREVKADREVVELALRNRARDLEARVEVAESKIVTREQIVEAIRPHLKDEAAVLAVSDEVDSLLAVLDATAEEVVYDSSIKGEIELEGVVTPELVELAMALPEAISLDEAREVSE